MSATKDTPPQWRVSSPKVGKARHRAVHWIVRPGERVGWYLTAEDAQAEADKRNGKTPGSAT